MPTITNKYYFVGEINLPMNSNIEASINQFIGKYEPEYLERALGYSLAKDFIAAIADSTPVAPSRWFYLLKGGEFTDSRGNIRRWKGFDNTERCSPIANLVYYWWTADNATATTSSGEKENKSENTSNALAAGKQMRAYNEMCDLTALLQQFLKYFTIDGAIAFPEFDIRKTDCRLLDKIGLI